MKKPDLRVLLLFSVSISFEFIICSAKFCICFILHCNLHSWVAGLINLDFIWRLLTIIVCIIVILQRFISVKSYVYLYFKQANSWSLLKISFRNQCHSIGGIAPAIRRRLFLLCFMCEETLIIQPLAVSDSSVSA